MNHAAGPQQGRVGEQQELYQPRGKGGDCDGQQQIPAAVLLLQPRPYQQQKQHIAHIVAVARVAQNVGEKPHIGQRVRQGGPVYAEQPGRGGSAGGGVQHQHQQAEDGKAQHHRCVESDGKSFHEKTSFQMF